MISLGLRMGIPVKEIINQLKGIRGPSPMMTSKGTILSLPDAIGKILEEHMRKGEEPNQLMLESHNAEVMATLTSETPVVAKGNIRQLADFGEAPGCPECGGVLRMAEGCMSCPTCGFSRCS